MWLIGMMGAGKTTVGAAVADRVGVGFYDTDHMVEQSSGRSIARIWSEDGEELFRELEAQAVAAVPPGAIAAAGGGAVVAESNRRVITAAGKVIWLSAGPEELAPRLVTAGERPLLAGSADLSEVLSRLLEERGDVYRSVATHTLDVGDLPIEAVIDRVEEIWRS